MIVDNKIVDFQIACSNVCFFLSTAFTNCLKAKENLSIDISDPKSNSNLIYISEIYSRWSFLDLYKFELK